ncbi:hypothetical protein ABER75_07725 [Niallia taxi]|uniref:Uncharacterized protein n=1 Tax=Niallia taxi TaxID=2499688 RepID=A0A3S2TWD4_9BACI|nr:hypothetical protein [Niallia taxi]MCM3214940.1 hypothetical protein [Niallia taxi]MDK8638842.1 hypothetical protein [Niallia taxi]MED4036648.1 hypothetical protein [Niallia taxi]MED4053536.1 hypothetical protein [Niallia taxi]MED4119376.1 hypothetical protein [Niallia taxi]
MRDLSKLEAIMWSIALPGFSQLLMKQYWKGTLLVVLEFIINVQSNFNLAIMQSFLGNMQASIDALDFQWIMFYPCLYLFAMWDAYKSTLKEHKEYAFLPFVFSAYFVTVGVMYSTRFEVFGIFPGPIFTPMIFLIPGIISGFLVKYAILFFKAQFNPNKE